MANNSEPEKQDLKDNVAEREDIQRKHEHAFGERGWSSRGEEKHPETTSSATQKPEGVHETHGADWQEKFAKENSDKYGQWGGKPIEQRGEAQTTGGVPTGENPGDIRDVSPRGGYGIRETEKWVDDSDSSDRK